MAVIASPILDKVNFIQLYWLIMAASSLTKLLEKEMDRKEFLFYAGLILLTVTGVSGVLKNVSSIFQDKPQKGFGTGPYGK